MGPATPPEVRLVLDDALGELLVPDLLNSFWEFVDKKQKITPTSYSIFPLRHSTEALIPLDQINHKFKCES